MTTTPAAWTADAACIGTDPEAWFPGVGESVDMLRRICRGCEVRPQCLDLAMAAEVGQKGPSHLRFGFFGGMTPEERTSLARARKRAAV